MRNRLLAVLVSGLAVSLIAGSAFACGESLFRVGKGVAFRQYTAPLPGTILVVARTESELQFVEQLKAAGHDVHVVADPSLIGEELGKHEHEFDIVMAYFAHRAEVAAQTASASVAYLPVAREGTSEETEAVELYGRSVSSDDDVKTYLKTIHKTLKARG